MTDIALYINKPDMQEAFVKRCHELGFVKHSQCYLNSDWGSRLYIDWFDKVMRCVFSYNTPSIGCLSPYGEIRYLNTQIEHEDRILNEYPSWKIIGNMATKIPEQSWYINETGAVIAMEIDIRVLAKVSIGVTNFLFVPKEMLYQRERHD